MFVNSRVNASHKPFDSNSSQSHLNIFRVESEWIHDMLKLLQVIGLQVRVNNESNKI